MNALYSQAVSRLSHVYPAGEARARVRIVLEDAFGVSMNDVYADKVRQFSEAEAARFHNMVERVAAGEPVQYVVGRAAFGRLMLRVDRSVLVPRPETLELARWAAESCHAGAKILDIGTGSGCIAIYLALSVAGSRVSAIDVSPGAIATARANADGCGAKVDFREADILTAARPASAELNLVVSNPPYVCQSERREMERNVVDYEPEGALFVSDDDPLVFYRAIARYAAAALVEGGAAMVEINRRFGPQTAALFSREGFGRVELRKDEYGNDRMIKATKI